MDAKDVKFLLLRAGEFALKTFYEHAQTYPLPFGICVSSLVLYIFFPSVFYFLAFASPFVLGATIFAYLYLISHSYEHQATQNEINGKPEEFLTARQTVFQRNVDKGKNVVSSGDGKDEHDYSLSKLRRNGFDKRDSESEIGVSQTEPERSSSEEEDEEGEGSQKRGNKAVEWNEEDEKNLMDLDDSELERNRRLESLIARRRSRKLYKINTLIERKTLMEINGSIPSPAPLLASRSNPFEIPEIPDDQVPGSAPSILQPLRNPFDLPYDPMEEKPNLASDSFQQEFLFHKSLSPAPSIPNLAIDGEEKQDPEPDQTEETSSFNRTLSATDLVGDSTSQTKEEAEVSSVGENTERAAFKFPESSSVRPPSPAPCPIPKARSVPSLVEEDNQPMSESTRAVGILLNDLVHRHTPWNSIASDMQVEVSETGSPPLTGGSVSSSEEESYTYDGDIEKDVTSESDDMFGVSPHAPFQRGRELEMPYEFTTSFEKSEMKGLNKEKEAVSLNINPFSVAKDGDEKPDRPSPSGAAIQITNEGPSFPVKNAEVISIIYDTDKEEEEKMPEDRHGGILMVEEQQVHQSEIDQSNPDGENASESRNLEQSNQFKMDLNINIEENHLSDAEANETNKYLIVLDHDVAVHQNQDQSSATSSAKSDLQAAILGDIRTSSDVSEQRLSYVSESDAEERAVRSTLLEVLLPVRLLPSLPKPTNISTETASSSQENLAIETNITENEDGSQTSYTMDSDQDTSRKNIGSKVPENKKDDVSVHEVKLEDSEHRQQHSTSDLSEKTEHQEVSETE